ncbi:MAG: 2'-5' RNA ligase family protein [Nanoarchaeota archaeon]
MEYRIVYLIKGKAEKYHKKLIKDLAKEYNQSVPPKVFPSHATLKYRFETNRIKELESLLKNFVKKQKLAKIKIKRTMQFHDRVACLKLDFSKEANQVYKNLKKELEKISWLTWKEQDKMLGKFHSSLIFNEDPKEFKKIWKDTSKIKINFDLNFDNLAILKRSRKYWKIHKVFRIND